MSKSQPLAAKIGEVKYREKLAEQHLGKVYRYEDEYTSEEMWQVIRERADGHQVDFEMLEKKGVKLTPFLEIGTGYGQAGLVLANRFQANGYATDIALGPLKSIKSWAKKMRFRRIAELLVCDAEDLPFPDGSFSFVFCYQTLHHFPDPEMVIKEAHRVLAEGGYFFFAEEPVAQTINLDLWKRPTRLRWWERVLRALLILPFVSKIGKTEIDQGILEESFPLKTWMKALEVFEVVKADLTSFPWGVKAMLTKDEKGWKRMNLLEFINRVLIFGMGGGITGLAGKKLGKRTNGVDKLPIPNRKGVVIEGVRVILKKELLGKLYGWRE